MTKPRQQEALGPQLEALVREFSTWWASRGLQLDDENKVHQPLYHYTNMSGLVGILDTEQMWFANIFHLNDPSELGYGINMAVDILAEQARNSGDEHVSRFCKWVSHVLVTAGSEIFVFYVASFSRESNDLGQWRAYGDNGRGVALGLSPALFSVAGDQNALGAADKTWVANVIYDPVACRRTFRLAIERAVVLVSKGQLYASSDHEREVFGRFMAQELAVPMFIHALTSKHPAYAHERETRLLLLNRRAELDPVTNFRVRGSTLVPYVASRLPVRAPGAITKVIVGPAAGNMADHAVAAFLRKQGLSQDIVERSDIPYTALRPPAA